MYEEYDLQDLIENYGAEYVQEYYPDDMCYPMDEISEFISDVWEALRSSFFGYDFNPHGGNNREQFNPNREYFAFNAYGNLVSIDQFDYVAWLERVISEDEFVEWCAQQGYIDEVDEEDIEGCKGVGMVSHLAPTRGQKSFGGKAVIDDSNGFYTLYSYDTPVAQYDKQSGIFYIMPNERYAPNGKYSMTTTKHIRAFADQLGVNVGKATVGAY